MRYPASEKLEGHGQPGFAAEASFGSFRAVPDGCEGALDEQRAE